MRPRLTPLVACLPLLLGIDVLRSKNRQVEEGNAQLRAGKADEALTRYDKAAAKLPNDPAVRFDRGAALSALGRHDEAALEFLRATEAKVPGLKAAAFYNLGNSFFHAGKFGEAVEAYKRSLALVPGDVRAKWNLELALKKKRDEDQKKQEQKKKDDQSKGEPKDDKKDGEQKPDGDKKQQDQKSEDQKPQDQKQEDQKPEDQQQKPDPQKPADEADSPKPDPQKPEPPKPEPPNGQGPNDKSPGAEPPPADLREIDAVLDSLERSPKALEQERARVRAVRRRAPQKDW